MHHEHCFSLNDPNYPKKEKEAVFFVTCSAPTDEGIHVKIVQTY